MDTEKDVRPLGVAGGRLGRRELLTRTAPACALACFGIGRFPRLEGAAAWCPAQGVHKFDVKQSIDLSSRDRIRMQYGSLIRFINSLRNTVGDEQTADLLIASSEANGRLAGEQLARRAPDTSFRTFTAQFRPPRYADTLTYEIIEDTDHAFGLRVTECVWAEVFREARMDGDIGHAAVCNMDYFIPPAFNPMFSMERTRTLMRGDDHCNHRCLSGA